MGGLRSNLQRVQSEHIQSTQTFEETCAGIVSQLDEYAIHRTRFLIERDAEARIKQGGGGPVVEGAVRPLYLLNEHNIAGITASCENAPVRAKVWLLDKFWAPRFDLNKEMMFAPDDHNLEYCQFISYLNEHPTYRHPREADSPTIFPEDNKDSSWDPWDGMPPRYKTQPYFFLTVPKLGWEVTLQPTELGRQFLESIGKLSREEGVELDVRLCVFKNHSSLMGSKIIRRAASASIPLSSNPPTSYSLQPEGDFTLHSEERDYSIAARVAVHYRIPL